MSVESREWERKSIAWNHLSRVSSQLHERRNLKAGWISKYLMLLLCPSKPAQAPWKNQRRVSASGLQTPTIQYASLFFISIKRFSGFQMQGVTLERNTLCLCDIHILVDSLCCLHILWEAVCSVCGVKQLYTLSLPCAYASLGPSRPLLYTSLSQLESC